MAHGPNGINSRHRNQFRRELLHAFGLGDRDAGLGYVKARSISCRGRTRADSDDYGNQNDGNDDSHTDSSDVSHANARPRAANSAD